MKRPAVVYSVEILLLLLLLGGVLLLAGPVSARLDATLDKARDSLLNRLETETGLSFSYESMSPSLFRMIRIKNLVITDAINRTELARISDTEIRYSILDLVLGKPERAIREITIQNATIVMDAEKNQEILARFRASGDSGQEGTTPFFSQLLESADILVRLKNISVIWADPEQNLSVTITTGSATLGSGGLAFNLGSALAYERESIREHGPIRARFSVDGSLESDLENGSATFTMESLSGRKFSLSRFALVTSYRNGLLQLNSVQDLQPVDIFLQWEVATNVLSVEFECDQLFPLKWVQLDESLDIPASLDNLTLTGNANFTLDEQGVPSYAVSMKASLPDSAYGGGTVTILADGDDTTVYSHAVGMKGPRIDFDFTGMYNFRDHVPEGLLSIRRFELPGGDGISGDLYIQRTGKGFEGIIPALTIHDSMYTSVIMIVNPESDSVMAFSLDADDETGHISAEGTYATGETPFLDGYLAFDSISVRNSALFVHQILYPEQDDSRESLSNTLDPFGLTTEIFFSSDLSQFSFNCTRLVIASSEKDGLYLLLSAKGNESSLEITDITVSPDRFSVLGNIHADYDREGDIVFDTDFTINTIPYHFNGMYSDRNLSLYGDYSLAVSMFFHPGGGASGVVQMSGLPIPVDPMLLSLSLDSDFRYNQPDGFKMTINQGSVEEIKGMLPLDTRLRFAGSVENTGVFLHELSLYDRYSSVNGTFRLTALNQDGGDRQYEASLDMASPGTGEFYLIAGTMLQSSELFFEANAEITGLPLMRVTPDQGVTNLASLTASVSGTPATLFAAAELSMMNIRLSGSDLAARGAVLLEDGLLTLYDTILSWNGHTFSEVSASLSMESLSAELQGLYKGILDESPVQANLSASFIPVLDEVHQTGFAGLSKIDTFTLSALADGVQWTSIATSKPFPVTLIREPGITAVYAGYDDMITGFLLDDGTVSVQASGDSPVTFTADGKIDKQELSVSVRDVVGKMDKIWPFTNIPYVQFDSGLVTGAFEITGLVTDPEFYGEFSTSDILVYSPGHFVEKFTPEPFVITADGKTLSVKPFLLRSDKSEFSADAIAYFDRWIPNRVELNVDTMPGKQLLVDTENPYFTVEGRASCNLFLSFSKEGIVVRGPVGFDRGSFAIMFSGFMNSNDGDNSSTDVFVDLKLDVGQKVEFRWPSNDFPILRGLIQAEEPVLISYDSSQDTFSLKGFANLKGGELFYIKRSFYLRQGSISFNENQDIFDPMISLRAEIRERDEKGEPVRIILSVENQPLSSFSPVMYSEPPKSSVELMALLGQAASADSTQDTLLRDTIVTASDIFAQMGLFRTVENSVRDVLHLDIFSIRTLLIQNAILQQSMQPAATSREMTFGNYFDNTTVYMGKYFGSAVYADALLHFSYYDPKSAENTDKPMAVYENLLFQPELGLEITTPFFTVRWGVMPDSTETFFIADTSVTLSWKFSY